MAVRPAPIRGKPVVQSGAEKHLNTRRASLIQRQHPPPTARRIGMRQHRNFDHSPKHAIWLKMAEIEFQPC